MFVGCRYILFTFLLLAACAPREEKPHLRPPEKSAWDVTIFEPNSSVKKPCAGTDVGTAFDEHKDDDCETADEILGWLHIGPPHKKKTAYALSRDGGKVSILAVGQNSASGLVRRIAEVDPRTCSTLEWEWRVDAVQKSADLRTKEGDDVAASVSIVFGNPGFWMNIVHRPTIRYVWTNGKSALGEVVNNPHTNVVRSIVIRNEPRHVGTWVLERRNILHDYRMAFGREPQDPISVVGLFTDNDGTREPAVAHYGSIKFSCGKTQTARE